MPETVVFEWVHDGAVVEAHAVTDPNAVAAMDDFVQARADVDQADGWWREGEYAEWQASRSDSAANPETEGAPMSEQPEQSTTGQSTTSQTYETGDSPQTRGQHVEVDTTTPLGAERVAENDGGDGDGDDK